MSFTINQLQLSSFDSEEMLKIDNNDRARERKRENNSKMTTFLRLPISWISFRICLTSILFSHPVNYPFLTIFAHLFASLFPNKQTKNVQHVHVCLRILSLRNCLSWQPTKWIYFIINLFGNGNILDCQKNTQADKYGTHISYQLEWKKTVHFCAEQYIATGNLNVWLKANTHTCTHKQTKYFDLFSYAVNV